MTDEPFRWLIEYDNLSDHPNYVEFVEYDDYPYGDDFASQMCELLITDERINPKIRFLQIPVEFLLKIDAVVVTQES